MLSIHALLWKISCAENDVKAAPWVDQMRMTTAGKVLNASMAVASILLVLGICRPLPAQDSPYSPPSQGSPYGPPESYGAPEEAPGPSPAEAPQVLSQDQLTSLVAPIALYPDPLLSQILVVSTYPQELMDAEQWLQYNGNLQGQQLMQAAQQQNWDPSVQALVAFPNVMAVLTSNMQWTSELGQAFLAQPTDVMNAIQYLRAQAQSNGQLANTPELSVNTEYQNGERAIEIEPVNPQVMYVPAYNPYSVWGPPPDGSYPALSYAGSVFGSLFSAAVNLAGVFSGFTGMLGPSGWGWALGWLAHTLFVNNGFFSLFGFHNGWSGGWGGRSVWVHNAAHGGPAYAFNGRGGWRGGGGSRNGGWDFGRGRNFAGVRAGAGFPGSYRGGSGNNWQRNNRETGAGNWRNYAHDPRTPAYQARGRFGQSPEQRSWADNQRAWAGNRANQPYNRFAANGYARGSVSSLGRFPGWRSPARNNGAVPGANNRMQSAPRDLRQTRWSSGNFARASQPRMNSRAWSRSFSGPGSGAGRAPKAQHFKEPSFKQPHFNQPHFKQPHFKAPHFKSPHFKSGGSGHFSGGGGHGGGKHHR